MPIRKNYKPKMEDFPETRKHALALGSLKYFTGKKCRNGHVSPRYTKTGSCCICDRESGYRNKYKHTRAKKSVRDRIEDIRQTDSFKQSWEE